MQSKRNIETQFASDTEEMIFREEWERTRKRILELTKGKTIFITQGSKEYKKDYGFIDGSRSETSD